MDWLRTYIADALEDLADAIRPIVNRPDWNGLGKPDGWEEYLAELSHPTARAAKVVNLADKRRE